MQPDARAFVADALAAAEGIERRIKKFDLASYLEDEDIRLIVERLFITMAEALNALSQTDPATAAKIPGLSGLVAFRNILVHRYRRIDPSLVYALARDQTGQLKEHLAGLLAAADGE